MSPILLSVFQRERQLLADVGPEPYETVVAGGTEMVLVLSQPGEAPVG